MNINIKNIENIRLDKQKRILIGIICAFLLYVGFGHILKMQLAGLRRTGPQIMRLKKDIAVLNRDLGSMRSLQGKLPPGSSAGSSGSARIISESQLPGLLQEISELANRNEVAILQIKPAAAPSEQKQSGAAERFIPFLISLEVVADYHSLGRFINALENNPVFLSLQQLKISAQSADYLKQRINLVLKTYVTK